MIVNLSVRPPHGEPRAFEFRRALIAIGAGSRNDLVVPSEHEVVRALVIEATTSGVRIVDQSPRESIRVVLAGESEEREVDPSLILPPGTRILVGVPATEITVERVRRAEERRLEVLGDFPSFTPVQLVRELAPTARDEALRVAYDMASLTEPRRVVAELAAAVERSHPDMLDALQLALPVGLGEPWSAVRIFGSGGGGLALESFDFADGDLRAALGRSEILECEERGARVILLPAVGDGRLRAVVAITPRRSGRDTVEAVGPLMTALRPLLLAFAAGFHRHAEMEALEEENRYFKDRQRREYLFKELVTESPAMRRVHRRLGEFVSNAQPVLLAGEAGTGKELLARALHHLGPRASGVLVSQHCSALDEDALDFELFGYARRGDGTSFASRRGIFELANGGTVFLDEVHALSPRLQMKLYRMIVEGEVFRIGESLARAVDVRIVAASHLDLMELADEGRFRRDLAICLTRQVLDVPPLRDRREDIAPLVSHFVRKWARRYRKQVESVDPETMSWLQKLRWPGNVRELLTVIERAVLQADPDQLTLHRADFELG